MKRVTKVWLIIAAVFTVTGGLLFSGIMTALGWNFEDLSTVETQAKRYEITEEFSNILIDTSVSDLEILPSKNGNCEVICTDSRKLSHAVEVKDGCLNITLTDSRKWHERIAITPLGLTDVTLYLPDRLYENITVKVTVGDVSAEMLSVKTLDVTVSTGDIVLNDISCNKLLTFGSTGDLTLKRVVASESFNLNRSTGNIKFDSCDAPAITAKTSTGNLTGSLLSGKIFKAKTSTGSVKVPANGKGGSCELKTSTGDIKIEIK